MDRPLRSLAAACAFALAAFAGSPSVAHAEPDAPRSGDIEVFRGGERSVVRGTLHDRSLREERGVLGTRGVAAGAPDPALARDALDALGGPARERLRADLEAIGRIYAQVLELTEAPELATKLTALDPGEPLRVPHRHAAASRTLLTRGQALAERTRHEASHAWVQALAPGAPPWLDEGLACYFEGLERGPGGEIRVRANARRHGALRNAARAGELPDLAKLEKLSRADLAREPASAASWALAFSLMQTPATREIVRALLRGEPIRGVASPLEALGAEEPGELPRTWRRTASGGVAPQLLVARPEPVPEREPEPEEPEPRYRRELSCVRGTIAAGTPDARPVLFCTRRRVRVDPNSD